MEAASVVPPVRGEVSDVTCKCTQLTDLPVPMYDGYVVVKDNKIYFAGGNSPDDHIIHQVLVYDTNTEQWSQLPPPGQYYAIPAIIGGKLVVIGGRLSANKEKTNKVTTYNEVTQTWMSHYPDLCIVRSKPGVVTYLEHVIVAGGGTDGDKVQNDIEVLHWTENSHWRMVSIKLPLPMWGYKPTICDGNLLIVGFHGTNMAISNDVYKIPVTKITVPANEQSVDDTSTEWTKLTSTNYWYTSLVPDCFPPVIVGGWDKQSKQITTDIDIYNYSSQSWKKIGSLLYPRALTTVASITSSSFIVIGGCTKCDTFSNAKSSSLTVIELGELNLSTDCCDCEQ
ncbi:uncharacterized protein [Dysidea avara]|uniref:uncharacterized protein isoform X2 n=1 Tax=Dysidea avara TaxID=196820 RepID=UPI00332231E9